MGELMVTERRNFQRIYDLAERVLPVGTDTTEPDEGELANFVIRRGEQFVGRLDPKADRKQKTFIVRKLIFEPKFKNYDGLLPALAEKLRAFAAFNGCERIAIEKTEPGKVKTSLTEYAYDETA